MKIDISEIESVLLEKKIEPVKVSAIIKELEQIIDDEKEDRAANKLPPNKQELVIIINDPELKISGEFTGWVVSASEGIDQCTILDKLTDAAKTQNEAAKRKKNVIQSFGDLFESLKPKFLKEKGLKIKTKEAVRVFAVNGKTSWASPNAKDNVGEI